MRPPELDALQSQLLALTGVAVVIEGVEALGCVDLPLCTRHFDASAYDDAEVPGVIGHAWSAVAPWPRGADFVRGRAALGRALKEAGREYAARPPGTPGGDTSLTHAGRWAFAVAVASAPERLEVAVGAVGVGIDFEPRGRQLAPEAARFFLGPVELAEHPEPADPGDLLLWWTIKEACFKADPANGARSLRDYQIPSLAPRCGCVVHPSPYAIWYASAATEQGPISVAVALPSEPLGQQGRPRGTGSTRKEIAS